ncbi:hypothetical protein [Cohaesibacter intestini]|uniref:hypothetical protein n=1 Tax=Cohaesibacter intestini TaxID=2211145 RepID=UPI001FE2309C|nr:hypothetical protein [Cohaesibacter intestini]
MTALPAYITPDQIASHFGINERTVREKAKALGLSRKIGKKVFLLEGDVHQLMEACLECPSSSQKEAGSIITEAPLTVDSYAEVQKRLTKRERNGSRRKSKRRHGNVVSMDRGQI